MSECTFCHPERLQKRLLHINSQCFSILSSPRFTDADAGHALVIPWDHAVTQGDMLERQAMAVAVEKQRIARILQELGATTIITMQKTQVLVEEGMNASRTNMKHLHEHVIGCTDTSAIAEQGISWDSPDRFVVPTDEEVAYYQRALATDSVR